MYPYGYLEVHWVVISGVISPLNRVIITVTLLISPLITTHEPPSSSLNSLSGGELP